MEDMQTASTDAATARTINLVLADDHDILRQGLKLLLTLQPEIRIVGEAKTGTGAVEMARQLRPDIVVMDITMPEMDGLEACRRIRSEQPETQVLILTMHDSEEYFLQALRAGASGYLVKKAAPAELHSAVRALADNGAFLYPGLARSLIRVYLEHCMAQQESQPSENSQSAHKGQSSSEMARLTDELRVLSPRELEVLTLVAEGYTSQEIANRLVLSVKTVQAHRANIMEKLGLHDIPHLVRFAIRHGLISPDDGPPGPRFSQ
ncbi:response regulator transcription factor [Thermogemmatispora sp.]|uniref:response regulator transcription factor n=1 Tax=Thermogemmatispora sp. TaxID=1968838 RepID=UPI002627731A|nr:response regulator transcription factor [Thermogemmatispora sp.]